MKKHKNQNSLRITHINWKRKLTAFGWTFPLNFKIDMPSAIEPSLDCDKANVVFGSAKTRSKSGSMVTARPESLPPKQPMRVFGKAARAIRKLLRNGLDIEKLFMWKY